MIDIGFGADQKRRSEQHQQRLWSAEIIGLPQELADKLAELSPDARARIAEDMIKRITAGNLGRPEFPSDRAPIQPGARRGFHSGSRMPTQRTMRLGSAAYGSAMEKPHR